MASDKDMISKLPGDLKEVAEIIGVELTFKLVEHFGGAYIIVPKCEGLLREKRDRKIRRLYDEGNMTRRDLALKFDVTIRTIDNILSGTDDEGVPPPLFGYLSEKGKL